MGLRTIRKRYSDRRVRESTFRILRESPLCSMSTVTKRGRTHINTAYFCYSRDLEFFFLSDPGSLHCRNIQANPSMAMTVFRTSQEWGKPNRGLQLFGSCRETTGRQATRAARLYGKQFGLYAKWMAGTTQEEQRLAAQLRTYRVYRFVPSWIKILDEAEFGGGVFVRASVPRRRS